MLRVNQLAGFNAIANAGSGGGGGGITKVQFITSGTSATVPADWNSANNTIECIGAGSTGGGAYSKKSNVTLTPSGSVTIQVGAGSSGTGTAGDTWFNGASLAASSCGAKGAAGHLGGVDTSGIGDVRYSGGNSTNADCVGGGGAGGPNGPGGAGAASPTAQGGGGGGANNGGNGSTVGTGGTNRVGTGAGVAGTGLTVPNVHGGNGSNGGGGGGGTAVNDGKAAGDTYNGGAGSSDLLWTRTETSPGQTAGPGGGGGGSGGVDGDGDPSVDNGDGGAGALYGGGAGRAEGSVDGAGAQGIIILTWTT